MLNYSVNKQVVRDAIKNCGYKWDKSSYCYALSAMTPYYYPYDILKKRECIDMFYTKIETRFHCIEDFTTFKGLNCYN